MADSLDIRIRREKSYPHCGRLIIMEALNSGKDHPLSDDDLERNFSIDFPSMPDSIELARQADYAVVNNMVIPDGVHQYRFTSPLQIPFSFNLHYLDEEYCPDGALSLLRIAARLHSLILPFGDSKLQVTVNNDAPLSAEGKPQPDAPSPKNDSHVVAVSQEPKSPTFEALNNTKFDPPATCRLELMFTKENEPGIVCAGYVKDVKVVLKKPWMRGPGRAFNLPTWGEFSFTFVHRPGHGNSFSNLSGNVQSQQAQAYADIVARNFYNTRQLAISGNYRGFTPNP
jgi:hypothetical protein